MIKIIHFFLLIFIHLVSICVFAGTDNSNIFETDKVYYTIQVKSIPMENYKAGIAFYHQLKQKGHLVYYYQVSVKQRKYMRIRTGIFTDISEARLYGEKLKQEEGLEFFPTPANVFIDSSYQKFLLITTPSAIWLKGGGYNKELFIFNRSSIPKNQLEIGDEARISPKGDALVFYFNQQILKMNVQTKQIDILKKSNTGKQLCHSAPKWSPDGKYIAYLDCRECEVLSNLWLMKSDGTKHTCLVCVTDEKIEYCVKSFQWHPVRNEIFYIRGFGFDTVSVGGNLYLTDLKGNTKTLVTTDRKNRQEVYEQFRIFNDKLIYKIVHFDEKWLHTRYITHTLHLADLE